MCMVDVNSTQEIAGYGRVSKPDAAGYITPMQAVSDAEREQRLAAAREADAANPNLYNEILENGGSAGSGKGGQTARDRLVYGVGGAVYKMQNPDAGVNEVRAMGEIARQNAQARRDMAFVTANTAYLAKNEAKAPNTAAASRPTAGGAGGGGGATLLTGGTAQGALAAKKPTTQGRATLLGM